MPKPKRERSPLVLPSINTPAQHRDYVMYWLGGRDNYIYHPRPDLVAALPGDAEGEVTLTWQQLAEIMATVVMNSKLR